MRICIPIHSFAPGGVERVGLRLAAEWQTTGADVTVVLGRAEGATKAQAPPLRYATRPQPLPTARWQTLWLIWCLWHHLRRERVDVLFCAGNTYAIVCAAMKLLLGRRCPPVVAKISNAFDRRDMRPPVRAGYAAWLRLQGRLFDRFIATAPPMAGEAASALQVPPERIVTIANPVLGPAAMPTRAARGEGRRFLAVGRLAPQKNYPLMLQAFAQIARPGDGLTIAGDGSERRTIERHIRRLDLGPKVDLLGHVADVRPLLGAADALVLSSDYEGLPGVVVEALAAGVPIAATDCCASMRWLLGGGRFGVLAAPRDAGGLAAAMEAAVELDPGVDTMRAFASQFTAAQAAPRYLALFEAVCSADPSGPDTAARTPAAADRNAAS